MTTNSSINLNNTNASASTFLRGDKTWVAIGTVINTNLPYASAAALTTGTTINLVSVSLGVGIWNVEGNIFTDWNGAPTAATVEAGLNTTSATFRDFSVLYYDSNLTSQFKGACVPPMNVIVNSGTTTCYLSVAATFATSTFFVAGNIMATRIV